MNGFVIAVGTYLIPLLKQATATAKEIGLVSIEIGDTACEVPSATDRIAKAQADAGVKRKTMRC